MRVKGDTLVFKQDRYAQELIASGIKPKTAYQRARIEISENQPSPYPQKAALDLAQQRAAPNLMAAPVDGLLDDEEMLRLSGLLSP